jgi:adenine-specific DNA-methyltransferase
MKYMGSKRTMLLNGLGDLLVSEAKNHDRVVDLFCGASSVAWFAARQCRKPVLAVDLQTYATALAGAVIKRANPIDPKELEENWVKPARAFRSGLRHWSAAEKLDGSGLNIATWCKRARDLCSASNRSKSPIWSAYGGYYFSPTQAATLDALIRALPKGEPDRCVCLAATIIAASKCAASPGHTAQPFQPTRSAGSFLREAWERDPLSYANAALKAICPLHAKVKGTCKVADAVAVANRLRPRDLVFVDPPYSDVHYSRFYHVLETVARGTCGPVSGVGRYPPPTERPASEFSRKTRSLELLGKLLERLAKARCTVIFTFPAGECSNGLSGRKVVEGAGCWFKIESELFKTRFSTLGGNGTNRKPRHNSQEMILLMRPR